MKIHFFPILFNGTQVYEAMLAKCGSTQNSGPGAKSPFASLLSSEDEE